MTSQRPPKFAPSAGGVYLPSLLRNVLAPGTLLRDGDCSIAPAIARLRRSSTPVGSFPANGFGLYDLHGNLWEWCEDFWQESYTAAPTNGSAWIKDGDSAQRIVRGGFWANNPQDCRSALRNRNSPGVKIATLGSEPFFLEV